MGFAKGVKDFAIGAGILGVLAGVGYLIFRPRFGFHYFNLTYFAKIDDKLFSGAPGSRIPIAVGSAWGGVMSFRHRLSTAGKYEAFIALHLGGQRYQEAISEEFEVGLDADWKTYEVSCYSKAPFDPLDLEHCRLISVRYGIREAGTNNEVKVDTDADCFHYIATTEFNRPNCRILTYWSDSAGEVKHIPGVAPMVMIHQGESFGAKVQFRHRYLGGKMKAVVKINMWANRWNIAEGELDIPPTANWTTSTIDVIGHGFEDYGYGHCRELTTYWYLYLNGEFVLEDTDDAAYHIIGPGEFRNIKYQFANNTLGITKGSGGLIPIAEGNKFSALVRFEHRRLGGEMIIRSRLDVNDPDEELNTMERIVELKASADWQGYEVLLEGDNFNPYQLTHCRRIAVRNQLLLNDEQKDSSRFDNSFHFISKPEFRNIEVKYWSQRSQDLKPPGSLVPIGDGDKYGMRVKFEHRFIGGHIGCWCGIQMLVGWNPAWGELSGLPTIADWKSYTIETTNEQMEKVFDSMGLQVCRRLSARTELLEWKDNAWVIHAAVSYDNCYHLVEVEEG